MHTQRYWRGVTLAQGDVVGVAVDVQLACVSFYINNAPVVRDADAEAAAKKGKVIDLMYK